MIFTAALRGPFRVRALVRVRWPRTGSPRRWRLPRQVPRSIRRLVHLRVREILDPGRVVDAGVRADRTRARAPDAEDRGERDLRVLVVGDVHSADTGHASPLREKWAIVAPKPFIYKPKSALPLLVPRVLADDPHHPLPADNLAVAANPLY
jgi:hypothetical protein